MIETPRLLLRCAGEASAAAVADYQRRNREFLRPFEPTHGADYYTLWYWTRWLAEERQEEADGHSRRFFLSPRETPARVIGLVSLTNVVRGAFLSCFMGYKLDAEYLNRGLMTEAVGAAVRWAFDDMGLHRIEANIMPRNARSARVAEKCGFVCEGVSRRYLKIDGRWEDHAHWVCLNPAMEEEKDSNEEEMGR